ncbi:hypothetical protein SAMN06295967_11491 [Belliella buryatensis]|uniref:6-bladed beta-propeller protein n=1 Tax=Belliella buryatensis TaxID=1500549 RepID=A0A239G2U6_9BACT|nr:hypothetical protein [Belliella buryatensis]SNS63390.1 hypothetical protein SAMN06295967_11491 [Belliella buryatensis]
MNKLFVFVLSGLLLSSLLSCGSSDKQENATFENLELTIIDSLQIDHLGQLYMIDLKEDQSEFLLYDILTNEFLRVNKKGEILQQVNRTGDGKDNYQSDYFLTAQYLDSGDILIETFGQQFIYDGEFNLKEKRKTPYSPITNHIMGSTVNLPIGEWMFSSIFKTEDNRESFSENFGLGYPLLSLYSIEDFSMLARTEFPAESQMVLNPGSYNFDSPLAVYHNNELYINFSSSPEIYVYNLPSMELKRQISLQPEENYKQNVPSDPNENFGKFFNRIIYSTYEGFNFSNGYLIAWYKGGAPKEEVDELPRNVVGQPEFQALQKKYEKYYYQIFQDENKLWEGYMDVKLESIRNLMFSRLKIGEKEDEVEKDYEVFYFYGVNID